MKENKKMLKEYMLIELNLFLGLVFIGEGFRIFYEQESILGSVLASIGIILIANFGALIEKSNKK